MYFEEKQNNNYVINCIELLSEARKNSCNFKQMVADDYEEDSAGVSDNKLCYYSGEHIFYDLDKREEKQITIKELNIDNNHGFNSNDWIKIIIHLRDYENYSLVNRSRILFQRIIYVKKSWSTKILHHEIFKYFYHIIALKEKLSKEDNLDIFVNYEKYFVHYFKSYDDFTESLKIDSIKFQEEKRYPYRVRVIRSDGAFENKVPCFLCLSSKCHGCFLPCSDNLTIKDLLSKFPKNEHGLEIDNNFLYFGPKMQENISSNNRDFILELSWLNEYREYVKSLNNFEELDLYNESTILSKNTYTLYKCFQNLIKMEELDVQNKWECSKCHTLQQAKKQMQIVKLPSILILHLKRFNNNSKIKILIDFPITDLNLNEFIEDKHDINYCYELIGVANHIGDMGFGHYTAFCKNEYNDKWFRCDDEHISEMKKEDIVTSSAYVLFYKRLVK